MCSDRHDAPETLMPHWRREGGPRGTGSPHQLTTCCNAQHSICLEAPHLPAQFSGGCNSHKHGGLATCVQRASWGILAQFDCLHPFSFQFGHCGVVPGPWNSCSYCCRASPTWLIERINHMGCFRNARTWGILGHRTSTVLLQIYCPLRGRAGVGVRVD